MMMKKLMLFIAISSLVQFAHAQINWKDYSQTVASGDVLDNDANIGLILNEKRINNAFWKITGESSNSYSVHEVISKEKRPSNFFSVATYDTAKVHFFLHGVNAKNADNYVYRVIENSTKTIVPWAAITLFSSKEINKDLSITQPFAYLGGYSAKLGNYIVVDVKMKSGDRILYSCMTSWEFIKPTIQRIYTTNDLKSFLKKTSEPWRADPPNVVPFKGITDAANNSLIFYLKSDVDQGDQIEYQILKDSEIYRPWQPNEFDNTFIWIKNLPPGSYLLKIRYTVQRQHVTEYHFKVKPAWYQSAIFKVMEAVLFIAFAGFCLLAVLVIKQKRKAERELSNKTKLQLELKSIHAQLNPHFIFNALASIQGLINKNDIAGANHYLSVFGSLMRDSLNNTDKDQIPLAIEIKNLETYLKLEQLRFGFKYNIYVDDEINTYETEMPSLLLQPLLENAVKHGIATLHEKGIITLSLKKINNNMIALIEDNGKGFDADLEVSGFGLKLTKDRIKLLGQMMQGITVILAIESNHKTGTSISLKFNNWFL
jgi:two-component system LytT family sensor kinase